MVGRMTKIDIVSGFLGAGKTTLIKKLLKEALQNTQVVLIENEFGEIGIDGGFLKEVLSTYTPERVLIEPSGVGKLSDVMKAVQGAMQNEEVVLNSAVVVVDAGKCKMYMKNFGEFFINQIAYAGTIILSRTGKMSEEKVSACTAATGITMTKSTAATSITTKSMNTIMTKSTAATSIITMAMSIIIMRMKFSQVGELRRRCLIRGTK